MFKWIVRAVVFGCVLGTVLGIGVLFNNLIRFSPIFNISGVEVRGADRTDRGRLEAAFKPLIGYNIFTEILPNPLLADDPWIVKIEMKRVIPNRILVLVKEEKEILSFKRAGKCYALTERGTEIPMKCEGVKVNIAEKPFDVEFNQFVRLYAENEILRQSEITLRNGFFLVNHDGMSILATYDPELFAESYDVFRKHISQRYKNIDRVDVTVRGRIYVKGALNG